MKRILAFSGLLAGIAVIAAPVPKANEPAWMAAFRARYELKEGEHVRRVPAPYIMERVEFDLDAYGPPKYPEADAANRKSYEKHEKWLTIFVDQEGRTLTRRCTISHAGLSHMPAKQRGDNLFEVDRAVSAITGYEPPEYRIDPQFKDHELFREGNLTVHGDWVVRRNTPMAKLAPQLEAILRNECKIPVTLTVELVEQEVYVVAGTFALKPPPWREKKILDIYATDDGINRDFDHFDFAKQREYKGRVKSLQYSGRPDAFVRFLGDRVKMRMVWDNDLPAEPKFSWNNHLLKNPTAQEEADDHDPEKVLKHAAEQTGLTFKKEKRKVPVLVIGVAELK